MLFKERDMLTKRLSTILYTLFPCHFGCTFRLGLFFFFFFFLMNRMDVTFVMTFFRSKIRSDYIIGFSGAEWV